MSCAATGRLLRWRLPRGYRGHGLPQPDHVRRPGYWRSNVRTGRDIQGPDARPAPDAREAPHARQNRHAGQVPHTREAGGAGQVPDAGQAACGSEAACAR